MNGRIMIPMLSQPLPLGSFVLPNAAILAPLAGVTDLPFRRICAELGAGLTYVEMLSSIALIHGNQRTREMLARHADEKILGVQVTGPQAEGVGAAVRLLDQHGFDTIDINMGCPVRKIVGSGSGAAFLKDLDRIRRTVELARAATARPLSIKIRIGFTPDAVNVDETAAIIAKAGADMITIHGRTREDSYGVPVSYPGIARGIRAARSVNPAIITIGNGDIMNAASAQTMVRETGCQGVMLSRGTLGNPWIFEEVLGRRTKPPTLAEWGEVVLRHLAYHEAHYGDNELSARLTRKHLIWYASGYPHSHRLRAQFSHVLSMAQARQIIRDYLAEYPADVLRYQDTSAASHLESTHDPKFEMDRQFDRGVGHEGLTEV